MQARAGFLMSGGVRPQLAVCGYQRPMPGQKSLAMPEGSLDLLACSGLLTTRDTGTEAQA
jgi:hypothetical protein